MKNKLQNRSQSLCGGRFLPWTQQVSQFTVMTCNDQLARATSQHEPPCPPAPGQAPVRRACIANIGWPCRKDCYHLLSSRDIEIKYMFHILSKCVESFLPTSPFPGVAPCLSRARSGTPLLSAFITRDGYNTYSNIQNSDVKTEATKWQHNEQKESENGSMHSSGSASPAPSWSRCYIRQNDFQCRLLAHQNLVLHSFAWFGSDLSCLGLSELNLPIYSVDKSLKT